LNMAFGRVSTTTAMTSIASSFDKRSPLESPDQGPNLRHSVSGMKPLLKSVPVG
jgi:hypothetical protein